MKRYMFFCYFIFFVNQATAADVDLSININSNDQTWELVAVADGDQGLAGLRVLLKNVTTIDQVAPRGVVNAGAPAGLSIFEIDTTPAGYTEVILAQEPVDPRTLTMGQKQSLFYGIGALAGGTPTSTPGISYQNLTNVMGSPWGLGDVFLQPSFEKGVVVLSGTYTAGQFPSFETSAAEQNEANVYSVVGTDILPGLAVAANLSFVVRGLPGDYNFDGVVNGDDLNVWRLNYGQTGPDPADHDRDGDVDGADFLAWLRDAQTERNRQLSDGADAPLRRVKPRLYARLWGKSSKLGRVFRAG